MTSARRRVWVTRTMPGALRTGARLRALGYAPVVAPLLQVRPRDAAFDLAGAGALAFTSPNGVAAFARARRERHLPVFAVGDGTAAAARGVGFARVASAAGDLAALVELIARRRSEFDGWVLRPGAAQAAGDIVAELRAVGVECRVAAIYETAHTAEDSLEHVVGAADGPLAAVLLHSPRAARRLSGLFADRPAPATAAVCISPAAAAALGPATFPTVVCAERPTERDLIAALAAAAAP